MHSLTNSNTDDVTDKKFSELLKRMTYLGIGHDDKESLNMHMDEISDEYKFKHHDNIIRLMKSEEHIDGKWSNLQMNGMDPKNLNNPFHKVKMVKVLEGKYGLDFLEEVGANSGDTDDDFYNLIKRTFRLRNS